MEVGKMEYKIESKLLKHLSKVVDFVSDGDSSPFEEDENKHFVFDLVYGKNDNIVVIARDENGKKVENGSILSLTSDGKLKRYKNVNKALGFAVNAMKQIALEK